MTEKKTSFQPPPVIPGNDGHQVKASRFPKPTAGHRKQQGRQNHGIEVGLNQPVLLRLRKKLHHSREAFEHGVLENLEDHRIAGLDLLLDDFVAMGIVDDRTDHFIDE